jgi:hypothetical protein
MTKARVDGPVTRGWRMPASRGRPRKDAVDTEERISYAPAPGNDKPVSASVDEFHDLPPDDDQEDPVASG